MRLIARALVVYAAANAILAARENGVGYVVHNLVAHPLLVMSPGAGEVLHRHTAPTG